MSDGLGVLFWSTSLVGTGVLSDDGVVFADGIVDGVYVVDFGGVRVDDGLGGDEFSGGTVIGLQPANSHQSQI